METVISPDATKRKIIVMLETLAPDDLKLIERLAACLGRQELQVPGLTYPTILVPGERLAGWAKPRSQGYEGNALEDTEALYDGEGE